VAQSASITSSVTERYASALFDLALQDKAIEAVEADLQRFAGMIDDSADLCRLIDSPVFSADEQFAAIDKIMDKAEIGGLVGNFIRVVASNRRLFIMPGVLPAYRRLAAAHRGEVTAEVTVAKALTAQQTKDLKAALKSVVGKDVTIDSSVDPSLLGGMIVKVGSRQIDTSLKTKLSSLKLTLKEVG
jgi:F-type H+-transporting ATPase subunit delta